MKNFFKKSILIIAIIVVTLLPNLSAYAEDIHSEDNGNTSNSSSDSGNSGSNSGNSGSSDSGSNDSGGSEVGGCSSPLLPGMVPWYCNVNLKPSQDEIGTNVAQIATNITEDIVAVAAYLTVGFVIYGGYLYIFSSGDPAKTASGKKTLTRAFIGLAIIAFAKIIISSVGIAIANNSGLFENANCAKEACVSAADLAQNSINWFIGIAGFVSAIFVFVGGIGYMTASGDPTKLQKAKATLTYALIGLAIVGLAVVISNFVIDMINNSSAGASGDIREPIKNLLVSSIALAGTVCVIFIVKGGIGYMTSTGDANKLKKARETILYACIGLIICGLTFVIVNWVAGVINDAESGGGSGGSSEVVKPGVKNNNGNSSSILKNNEVEK